MSRYVVDASVAVKWFVPETHGAAARRVLVGSDRLLAPDLLFPEVTNILWKKTVRRELRPDEAEEIIVALEDAPLDVRSSRPLVRLAFEVARRAGRTVYDGLYVALAAVEGCPLVTADRRLVNALRGGPFGPQVIWIEEA